ncbi:MAG TPA: DegV family protein [Acholeplasmataceae bacterium]|nr:DegV family protein [Acholeplasmataceae bacterium]
MSTITISNELLYKSFIIGAKNVISEKNGLNAINVFPVPDGDTGTNLASLMTTIIEKAKLGQTISETLQSIADAAIVGARGNSGIIFASYISGFAEGIKQNEVDLNTLIETSEIAYDYAYHAISQPVEGTMITVMRAWAHALKQFKQATTNAIDLFLQAFEVVKEELAKTPDMLKVLKENHVVDAGAKGFVHFIEGFIKAFKGEEVTIEVHETVEALHVDHLEDSQYRYCTEALIRGESLDSEKIRESLLPMGDSLVVAGSKKTVRIHIHTDHPEDVFAHLDGLARIAEQKVDDMRRQFEAANHAKYPIALVTDSIADLPSEWVDHYQIHQLPISLKMNDSEYLDKITIQSSRFYQMMDSLKVYPTSAQPNVKSLVNFFSFLTTYYREIIVITVSKEMSGTYNAFVEATKSFPDHRIHVINSKQNSGAEGLLVYKAAQLIEQGHSMDEVIQTIESLTTKSKILVSVKTLKYMMRSGRLTKVSGTIASLMHLKPVISIDEEGKGIIFAKALSVDSADKKIYQHVKNVVTSAGIEGYAIVHANAKERASQYEKLYTELTGQAPLYVMDISTVVAMNAGIGTVAIAYLGKE